MFMWYMQQRMNNKTISVVKNNIMNEIMIIKQTKVCFSLKNSFLSFIY